MSERDLEPAGSARGRRGAHRPGSRLWKCTPKVRYFKGPAETEQEDLWGGAETEPVLGVWTQRCPAQLLSVDERCVSSTGWLAGGGGPGGGEQGLEMLTQLIQ